MAFCQRVVVRARIVAKRRRKGYKMMAISFRNVENKIPLKKKMQYQTVKT